MSTTVIRRGAFLGAIEYAAELNPGFLLELAYPFANACADHMVNDCVNLGVQDSDYPDDMKDLVRLIVLTSLRGVTFTWFSGNQFTTHDPPIAADFEVSGNFSFAEILQQAITFINPPSP